MFIILYFINSNVELKRQLPSNMDCFLSCYKVAHSNLTRAVSSLCPAPDPPHRSGLDHVHEYVHWSAGSSSRQSTETGWSSSSSPINIAVHAASSHMCIRRPLRSRRRTRLCSYSTSMLKHLVTIHHCLVRGYVSAAHPSLWLVLLLASSADFSRLFGCTSRELSLPSRGLSLPSSSRVSSLQESKVFLSQRGFYPPPGLVSSHPNLSLSLV